MTEPQIVHVEWDDAALSLLRKLWREGVTCSRIGEALGRTKNAVIGKAHRLELPPRRAGGVKPPRPKRVAKPRRRPDTKSKRMLDTVLADVQAFRPSPVPKPRAAAASNPALLVDPRGPEFDREGCAYPLFEDSKESNRKYCNAPVDGVSGTRATYCTEHHARLYYKADTRERPAPFVKRARLEVLLGERV